MCTNNDAAVSCTYQSSVQVEWLPEDFDQGNIQGLHVNIEQLEEGVDCQHDLGQTAWPRVVYFSLGPEVIRLTYNIGNR